LNPRSRNKATKSQKNTLLKKVDKTSKCITITENNKGKIKMKTSNIFLPFWNLMAAIFVWFLFLEGLKKVGLIKSK